jgi:hypothetical protein
MAFHNFLQCVAREHASEYARSIANETAGAGRIGLIGSATEPSSAKQRKL